MEKLFSTPEEILGEFQRQEADISGEDSDVGEVSEEEVSDVDLEPESDDSDSETEGDESVVAQDASGSAEEFVSADGTRWELLQSSSRGRLSAANVLHKAPGPTSYARRNITTNSPLSAFKLLVDDRMIKSILECTVEHARERNPNWEVSKQEFFIFIALTYTRGILGLRSMSIKSCWDKEWGANIFAKNMTRQRYLEILRHLRFDQKLTRSQRIQNDKFALASELWYKFVSNSRACYNPGESTTVDEQLYPTKCRCRFLQYMANKPDKFGIKYWILADNKSKYFLNGFPYLGADEEKPQHQLWGEYVVMRLLQPYFGSGVNVTCNNYFTSVKLAENLRRNKISIVGTIRKNRREVPAAVKTSTNPLYTTMIYKNQLGHILTNYQGKKNKNVLLLSSLHNTVMISEALKKKPETVLYYNKNKVGVDVLDSMCRKYSTRSATRRWPVHVFYNVLDLAGINSWILYKESTGSAISRRNFLKHLVQEILGAGNEPPDMRPSTSAAPPRRGVKRRQCQIKQKCKNRSIKLCDKCKKVYCGSCAKEYNFCSICG